MENLFANLVLGHLVGDYLLQPRSMAINKSKKTLYGATTCFLHCSLYTLAICYFIGIYRWDMTAIIFLSHFPFDFWNLGDKWLRLIKGRNVMAAYKSKEKYHEFDLIFSCIVYVVVDNTFHLLIMFQILK